MEPSDDELILTLIFSSNSHVVKHTSSTAHILLKYIKLKVILLPVNKNWLPTR